MTRKFFFTFCLFIFTSNLALASGSNIHLIETKWPFNGLTGTVDRASAQRGFQVYREVCASCHSLKRVSYRNLSGLGFSEAEIKTISSDYTVIDGPNDEGEMFERPARPSDKFVSPYPNEKAARASNNGAYPPDLSLIVKSRVNGANYLYSLLNGYTNAPDNFAMSEGMYYNSYFEGHQIAMPSPLSNDMVEYQDGTRASVDQMSKDIVNFLQWTAEPEMEQRKRIGLRSIIYLFIFTILFYLAKKRIWARL